MPWCALLPTGTVEQANCLKAAQIRKAEAPSNDIMRTGPRPRLPLQNSPASNLQASRLQQRQLLGRLCCFGWELGTAQEPRHRSLQHLLCDCSLLPESSLQPCLQDLKLVQSSGVVKGARSPTWGGEAGVRTQRHSSFVPFSGRGSIHILEPATLRVADTERP